MRQKQGRRAQISMELLMKIALAIAIGCLAIYGIYKIGAIFLK